MAARARGRKGGRPKGLSKKAKHTAIIAERLYLEGELSIREICGAALNFQNDPLQLPPAQRGGDSRHSEEKLREKAAHKSTYLLNKITMEIETHTECVVCGQSHPLMAEVLGLCPDRAQSEAGTSQARTVHGRSRRLFALPESPPREEEGVKCVLCGCECLIGEGKFGFCGLRTSRDGKLRHIAGTPKRGVLHWYRDPVPELTVLPPRIALAPRV